MVSCFIEVASKVVKGRIEYTSFPQLLTVCKKITNVMHNFFKNITFQSTMYKLLYISLVGITPLAVANSIYYNIKECRDEIESYSVLFIKTETTSLEGKVIVNLLKEYQKEYRLSKWLKLPKTTESLIVSEINILEIAKEIYNYLKKRGEEKEYTKIVLDITGGRKAMSAGLLLALLKNQQIIEKTKVEVRYYLLKDFARNTSKKAPELFSDEYEIRKWQVNELKTWLNERQ